MKAVNIKWDIDCDDDTLPKEIEIPKRLTDLSEIANYLSDLTGYYPCWFDLVGGYAYNIYLDELDSGNLVGDNGECIFHSEKGAIKDAEYLINNHLVDEFKVNKNNFRIEVLHWLNENSDEKY